MIRKWRDKNWYSDPKHAAAKGGEVWRFKEGDLNCFLTYTHAPTVIAHGGYIPNQFKRSPYGYLLDLEIEREHAPFGPPLVHLERVFKTEREAREMFNFLVDSLNQMTEDQIVRAGRLSAGRMI